MSWSGPRKVKEPSPPNRKPGGKTLTKTGKKVKKRVQTKKKSNTVIRKIHPSLLDAITKRDKKDKKEIQKRNAVIKKLKSMTFTQFMKDKHIEYHLSSSDKLIGKQLQPNDEGLVFTTTQPHMWDAQLNYERGKKAPTHIYLAYNKEPSESATYYGSETITPKDKVIVLFHLGKIDNFKNGDSPLSLTDVEFAKEGFFKSLKQEK